MEVANVRIRLDKYGNDVPVFGCTPAEALVLHVLHQNNNGGSTFGEEMNKIEILGEAEDIVKFIPAEKDAKGVILKPEEKETALRTSVSELRRLQRKYGGLTNKKDVKIINLIFPDKINPQLPQKFADLDWKSIMFDGTEMAASDYGTSGGLAITR